uniref:Uncharacterized protein n=1 Tax=Arundo donax TaxID=35708 RepID=A0A0A9DQR1_ARUDO
MAVASWYFITWYFPPPVKLTGRNTLFPTERK